MKNHQSIQQSTISRTLLVIGIMIVAFNLRPAITAVGPLVSLIKQDLQISNSLAGFLTTLPLLSFALFSSIAPKLGNRFGSEAMVFVGLLLLISGILIRSTAVLVSLFIGTALVGIGIALLNVLLPSIVKTTFPTKVGIMTSAYSTSMSVFAALGSGLSIPLATGIGLGWEKALLSWLLLACFALIVWLPQLRQNVVGKQTQKLEASRATRPIWCSAIAWQVTIFMGFQAFLFYTFVTWLPEILHSGGLSIAMAGWMVSIMLFSGLPASFFTPMLADRFENQIGISIAIGITYCTGIILLFTSYSFPILVITSILLGIGQGASVSLALAFLGLRAANGEQAASLSGMAQSIGYFLAAVGPFLVGFLFDFTQSWNVSLLILLLVCMLMTVAGIGAGRNETIFSSKEQVEQHANR